FDLTLSATKVDDTFGLWLDTSRDLFDRATGERLIGHVARLAEAVAADPDLRLSQLSPLGAAERFQLVHEWNDTAAPGLAESALLHEQVAAWAVLRPDAPAVSGGPVSLTYGELALRSGQLARHLAALGVGDEEPVAICLERSPALVVSFLAVLQAGGAYLPLDP